MSVDRPLLEQNCCGDCLRTTFFPLPFDVSQIQGQPSWEGDCPEPDEQPTVLPHLLEHGFNRGPFPKRKQEIINEIGCSNAQRHFDEDGHLLEDELGQPQVERCKCVFYDSSSVTGVAIQDYSYNFYWQWKNREQKQDAVFVPHPVPPGFEHVPKFFRGPCTFKASVELPYAISTDMGRCEWGL
ncbi:MAG: hypothetical protein U1E05_24565 [Patescibacteria group bacterium]|nr:hypothetical protein [Patescibacteria group bacterium]